MSIQLHTLHSHFDFFRENLGEISEEHGERFHKDIQFIESRYQGTWGCAMTDDNVWVLVRDEGSVLCILFYIIHMTYTGRLHIAL